MNQRTHSSEEPNAVQVCDICDIEKPASMVDRRTVDAIAPLKANVCDACYHVQTHSLGDGRCMQCGDAVGIGFEIELEFSLGAAELPGRIAGKLCGDCAGWVATDINYDGLDADDGARAQLVDLLDEEKARMNELEASNGGESR